MKSQKIGTGVAHPFITFMCYFYWCLQKFYKNRQHLHIREWYEVETSTNSVPWKMTIGDDNSLVPMLPIISGQYNQHEFLNELFGHAQGVIHSYFDIILRVALPLPQEVFKILSNFTMSLLPKRFHHSNTFLHSA